MLRVVMLILMGTLLLIAKEFVVVSYGETKLEPLSRLQLKAIYLKKRRFHKDIKLIPLNLSPNDPLRMGFEKHILQMSSSEIERYWLRQHYRGARPPYRVKSLESLLLYLKRVKGSIAYIPREAMSKEMHLLYRGTF
jgi:hypothetical protein